MKRLQMCISQCIQLMLTAMCILIPISELCQASSPKMSRILTGERTKEESEMMTDNLYNNRYNGELQEVENIPTEMKDDKSAGTITSNQHSYHEHSGLTAVDTFQNNTKTRIVFEPYNNGDSAERLVETNQKRAVLYTVDLLPHPESQITARPGETVKLAFNVTNHQSIPASLEYIFQTRGQQIFQNLQLRPFWSNIFGGQSLTVLVTLTINSNIPQGTTTTVELTARPYGGSFPFVTRTVYLYVGVDSISDSDRPTVSHWIRNNCKNINQQNCMSATWNTEITVKDSNSGLISVISNPVGIQFQGIFVAGTKSDVPMYYSASCCAPIVDIIAKDARGNYNTYRIDANSGMSITSKLTINGIYDGVLADAEIAAIVLGVLLLIIIILAIVLVILLCRRRQSRNLPHN